jgi:hypothetical protein
VGTYVRREHKHGRNKKNAEKRRSFILKEAIFGVSGDMQYHGNIFTYDLVQCDGFKSEQLPEDGQLRPKYIAIDVVLMLF